MRGHLGALWKVFLALVGPGLVASFIFDLPWIVVGALVGFVLLALVSVTRPEDVAEAGSSTSSWARRHRDQGFLCDTCKWCFGEACSRPERPNAIECPDYRRSGG